MEPKPQCYQALGRPRDTQPLPNISEKIFAE